jgi:hypothetical protein
VRVALQGKLGASVGDAHDTIERVTGLHATGRRGSIGWTPMDMPIIA